MKKSTINTIALAAVFVFSAQLHAFERETGGRHIPMQEEYNCFNRAQLADAPSVSIRKATYGEYRDVTVTSRGVNEAISLTPAGSSNMGTFLKAPHILVTISADKKTAAVKMTDLGLTYNCKRARN
jgi:hypothetical protein